MNVYAFLKDWIKSGWITPVRNQQKCSNCYAFAATASIEASLWLKYKINVTLSPQQLTDCSTNYKNVGCNGGLVAYSFGYINDVGLIEDKYYSYIGKSVISFCKLYFYYILYFKIKFIKNKE